MKKKEVPIIDLFAGPGGLGEGFSSLKNSFVIKLSIEKDENAHQTLELRSFARQFNKGRRRVWQPNPLPSFTLRSIFF